MSEPARRHIRVVSAEIRQGDRYLITQRLATAVLPLLWEFPGGRVREGESDSETLERCLYDRLDVLVEVRERLMSVTHRYEAYDVTMTVYSCHLQTGELRAKRVHAYAWVSPENFGDYTFPGADQLTVEALLKSDY